jgi:hypothetical protein
MRLDKLIGNLIAIGLVVLASASLFLIVDVANAEPTPNTPMLLMFLLFTLGASSVLAIMITNKLNDL